MTFTRPLFSLPPQWFAGSLAVLAAWGMCFSDSHGQEGKVVKSIEVQYVGNRTVSPERILSNMSTKVGDKLSLARIDEDVKSLYAGGDVENVRILADEAAGGVALIVVAQTRAVYGGVEFSGNTVVSTAALAKKVELKVNKPIDESVLQTARQEILEIYRKKGFAEATVSYRIGMPTAQGYSNVIYTINEGVQGYIREIQFVGNAAFPAATLKEKMAQKEKHIIGLLGKGGSADAETLALDVRALEDFYRDSGYLNARVVNVARMRVDANYVDVVVTIEEGATYQVESISVSGVAAISMQDKILPYLKTKAGDKFAGSDLKADIKLISDQYGSNGYVDTRVEPKLEDAGNGGVRVVLAVTEGQAYNIGQIHIEGNDKTQDWVIRRELPLEPGQVFDTTKTDVTKRRLENMGYFSSVEISPQEGSYLNDKDLLIRVTEKPTGSVNFGAGFSSIDSVTGFFEVTQTNFDIGNWPSLVGAGQRFRFSVRAGNETKDVSISFTEPWLFGQRLAITTEGYYKDLLFLSDEYDQTNVGAAISLRKALGEFTYGVLEYRAEQIEIDVDSASSAVFLAEEGDFFKSSVGIDVVRDTRDNLFMPREGSKLSAGFEFAGLGGDVSDTIVNVSGSKYFTFPGDVILSLVGSYQRSAEGDHLFTRHFLGGANTLRGFDYRDVGPRDPITGEVLGGNQSWNGTVEVTVPVVDKIRAAAFYDVGEVSDGPAGSVGGGVNSDYGIGLRMFILGNAPVRLDYAFPHQTDGFQEEDPRFQFTLGAQF